MSNADDRELLRMRAGVDVVRPDWLASMPREPSALRAPTPARGFDIIPSLDRAGQAIAVADSSKLTKPDLSVIASAGQLDMPITDTGADPVWVDDLRQRGIDVLTV
ncbi:hypothetical protein [Burkholderia pyrrocinia]|uniref:hypothetical protein n=1 Tax=Burkholderia pyrrocinia TaxID=60550 RepID=UPI0020C6AEC8|nr:hypothetical protein [Burkholderia pyrrocinia]